MRVQFFAKSGWCYSYWQTNYAEEQIKIEGIFNDLYAIGRNREERSGISNAGLIKCIEILRKRVTTDRTQFFEHGYIISRIIQWNSPMLVNIINWLEGLSFISQNHRNRFLSICQFALFCRLGISPSFWAIELCIQDGTDDCNVDLALFLPPRDHSSKWCISPFPP